MKPGKSLLGPYLLINFLLATLLPVCILVASIGVFPTAPEAKAGSPNNNVLVMVGCILALFIVMSWLFFNRIRRRLQRLQETMSRMSGDGIPQPIAIGRRDEIGRLEESFNAMIRELEASRLREREEERLRRRLVADLSHDLRTPLTAMRGHVGRLANERLSPQGRDSLGAIDDKISFLGQLIDNLLSYTLLASGKYPYRPVPTDMVRLLRRSFVAWYPVFEQLNFRIELDLPETAFQWEIDPQWMERILDNCYQNVHRHAREGRYIGIRAERDRIAIEDRGPGMSVDSDGKGAGIGLAIAEFMLQEMKLRWSVASDGGGTTITIGK